MNRTPERNKRTDGSCPPGTACISMPFFVRLTVSTPHWSGSWASSALAECCFRVRAMQLRFCRESCARSRAARCSTQPHATTRKIDFVQIDYTITLMLLAECSGSLCPGVWSSSPPSGAGNHYLSKIATFLPTSADGGTTHNPFNDTYTS